MWVQSGMASIPRGWHVISSLSCLIGIWLGETQTSLLIHPRKMNSATIKTRNKVHTFQRENKWSGVKTKRCVQMKKSGAPGGGHREEGTNMFLLLQL